VELQKKILNLLHPLLKPASKWYLSKTRIYKSEGITVKIYPGIFHPGLFFSTKIFLEYLKTQPLQNVRVLELGAGSGFISIALVRRGALVTASDINPKAVIGLAENFLLNDVEAKVVESDLFDNLEIRTYDLIVINPPYYPKNPLSINDHAWYCGENFEYFKSLFQQINSSPVIPEIVMILSEECNIDQIRLLAENSGLCLSEVYRQKIKGEKNIIFTIKAL
jgi:release factor glutamine methyltransferase